jgi:hypothetical protein
VLTGSTPSRGHAADEVYVTGTFDGWKKTELLEKVGDSFEKTVTLADTTEKILYKVRSPLFRIVQQAMASPTRR